MVSLIVSIMPSEKEIEPGVFIPQSIFASNGQAILMGVLKKGELRLNTATSFKGKTYKLVDIQALNQHVKTITSEDNRKGVGIVLANNSIEEAQVMTNKELLFR